MIKTVRIASILTALLVVIIVALPVVLGANNGGTKTRKSFEVQSVVERFKMTRELPSLILLPPVSTNRIRPCRSL